MLARPVGVLIVLALLGAGGFVAWEAAGPQAAPDSGRIVFYVAGSPGGGSYRVADPISGRSTPFAEPGVNVARGAVEGDGRSAVVPCVPETLETSEHAALNLAICRVDLAVGARELIVDTGSPVQHPTPSPDGTSIVFASGAEADHGLKITPSDGGEVRSLCSGFCPLFRFFDIAWSPDGTRVAFVATTPGSAGHLPQIYVVTLGESDYTQLTRTAGNELDPAWSPDGTRLAFSSSRSGDTELWVMDADGSEQVQLTARPGFDIEPTWSPDGTHIAYSRRIEGSWDLAVIPASGGEPSALTAMSGSENRPQWLP